VSAVRTATEDRCDGKRFRQVVADAAMLLTRRTKLLDALNVFPVPDGDTGANMASTMRAALQAVDESVARDVGGVAAALAHGAFMGAHGNSGVILSQYLRGLARGLEGCRAADACALARALQEASAAARTAVDRPVEGTMLTVAHDVARVAAGVVESSGSFGDVLAASAREAKESVERTRGALPVLRQADVVDSGALGLATILEGMALSFHGEPLPDDEPDVAPRPAALDVQPETYGYCTEFVIRGIDLDSDAIRADMRSFGDSVVVVGDADLMRVHLHTFRPAEAIDYGSSLGVVDQIKVDDMQDQNRRLRACVFDDQASDRCALVVVADGDGFVDLFRSLGASVVVRESPALDPMVDKVLRMVREPEARECVVLCYDAALATEVRQSVSASGSRIGTVVVMATGDPARDVAAALVFQAERSAEENVRAMERALGGIHTAHVTTAAEVARLDPSAMALGDVVGVIGDRVEVTGGNLVEVTLEVLNRLGAGEREMITLYPSGTIPSDQVNSLVAHVSASFPRQQVELAGGGQSHGLLYVACE
jgi:DAK2 domain fusion protein YloV